MKTHTHTQAYVKELQTKTLRLQLSCVTSLQDAGKGFLLNIMPEFLQREKEHHFLFGRHAFKIKARK